MKKCPFCAEEILDEANKCKHCKSDLTPVNSLGNLGKPFSYGKNGKKTIWLLVGFIILILVAIGAFYFIRKSSDDKKTSSNSSDIQTSELSSQDIEEIKKSIVVLMCFSKERTKQNPTGMIFGSGTLIDKNIFEGKDFDYKNFDYKNTQVLTNGHVAELKDPSFSKVDLNSCIISFSKIDEVLGTYTYDETNHFMDNKFDVALVKYATEVGGKKVEGRPTLSDEDLADRVLKNYTICPKEQMVGKKVYMFGYPSSAFNIRTNKDNYHLIVTSGLISGKDNNGNYYTDASIDSGNSGGLAVSKIDNKICLVGIPTWVSQGNFENLGIIQPFEDVAKLFKEDLSGQLYKNEEYGFNIKFPSDWVVKESSDETFFSKQAQKKGYGASIFTNIWNNPEISGIKNAWNNIADQNIKNDFFNQQENEALLTDLDAPTNKNAQEFLEKILADFSKEFPDRTVIEKGITYITNKKVVYYKTKYLFEEPNSDAVEWRQIFYYTIHNGKLYEVVGVFENSENNIAVINKSIGTLSFNLE